MYVPVVAADTIQFSSAQLSSAQLSSVQLTLLSLTVPATNSTVGRNGRPIVDPRFRHKGDDKNRTHSTQCSPACSITGFLSLCEIATLQTTAECKRNHMIQERAVLFVIRCTYRQ